MQPHILNITITVGVTRPKRSSTKRMKVFDDEEEEEEEPPKKSKFNHKRNKGPGNRPPLISGSISESEEVDSGSDTDTDT